MKICLITSFFGPQSFGGDAVYVERLGGALARKGHEVHVIASSGAYKILRFGQPLRPCRPSPALFVHDVGGGVTGMFEALWTHQTGAPAFQNKTISRILAAHDFDVIHLHNISLLGGRRLPELIGRTKAVKLLTAHDYWWICPQSLRFRRGRGVCGNQGCAGCSLAAGRPPQLWRTAGWYNRAVAGLDAVLFPSRRAMEIYLERGFVHPFQQVLPGMIPAGWAYDVGIEVPAEEGCRPYFAAAGRLTVEKGFHTVLALMHSLPECDLLLAGSGPAERRLRKMVRQLSNVRFLGMLDHERLRELFRGARAVIVPSLFEETFGLAAAEALTLGVPVLARNRGSLPELIKASGGGMLFDSEDELLEQMKQLSKDDGAFSGFRESAGARCPPIWSEDGHVEAYLELIRKCRKTHGPLVTA